MRIPQFLLALLLSCSLASPLFAQHHPAVPPTVAGEVTVPFEPVFSGQQGGARRRGNMVIRSRAEWKRVFDISVASLMYKPDLPEVDFSKKMLVAVLLGEQIAIDRGVKVRRVVKSARALTVEYEATRGATRDVSGMAVTTTSTPFFFVAVPQSNLPVRFRDMSPPEVQAAVVAPESVTLRAADPGGAMTGSMDNVASGERGLVQDDKIAIVRATDPGQRLLANGIGQNRVAINVAWILGCAVLILGMTAGFALLNSTFVARQNATYAMLISLSVPLVAVLGFWLSGWALLGGAMGPVPDLGGLAVVANPNARLEIPALGSIAGLHGFLLTGEMYDVGVGAMFLLQLAYLSVALAIPFSFFATRMKLSALLAAGLLIAALIYPLQAHWTWGEGWLSQMGQTSRWSLGCGFVDFAGAGVVHAFGGLVALAGAMVLGRRAETGDSRPRAATAWIGLLGAVWLAGGWLAYTGAATYGASGEGNLRIGLILTSTLLAGTGGVLAALIYSGFVARQFSLQAMVCGLLAGLVSISGAVAFVSPSLAFCIGLFGGLLACFLAPILESRGLHDPLNLIGTHAAGGIWGVLAVGIFADGTYGNGWNQTLINRQPVPLVGILYGGTSQFLAQLVGLVVICAWAFGVSYAVFTVLARFQKGLVNEAAESMEGLDVAFLGLAPEPMAIPVPAVPSILTEPVLAEDEVLPMVRPTGAWNGRMPGGV